MNKIYIIVGLVVLLVVLIIAAILILKNKKAKNPTGPIHKEYDPSIASMVNNTEPIKGGTFIPPEPTNQSVQITNPTVTEPAIDSNGPDLTLNQTPMPIPVIPNVTTQSVAPVVTQSITQPESTVVSLTSNNIASEIQTQVEPISQTQPAEQISVQPVTPVVPIMPSLTDIPVAVPVMPEQPVEQPMLNVETPSVAAQSLEPVQPEMPSIGTPTFVTEPIVEQQMLNAEAPAVAAQSLEPVQPEMPSIGTSTFVTEPIVEQPMLNVEASTVGVQPLEPVQPEMPTPAAPTFVPAAMVEQPTFDVNIPEIALEAETPIMQDTEIPSPEVVTNDIINGVVPEQQKKEPMFVNNVEVSSNLTSTIHQDVQIDIPDMEEII